mmetsp:Transcript_18757/g.22468  ORF Transcript_18757/g.22468 Transcript_18757/m.22468 type:complete len:478 (+) Transcript_18757:102-1535(+)
MARNLGAVRMTEKADANAHNPQWLDRREKDQAADMLAEAKRNKVRITRYWPGKAPEWAPDEDDELEEAFEEGAERAKVAPVIIERKDDDRLRRLEAMKNDRGDGRRRHRAQVVKTGEEEEMEEDEEAYARKVADRMLERDDEDDEEEEDEEEEEEEEEEEDDEAIDARRELAKARMRARQREEEEELAVEEEDEEEDDDEEDSSEYETDSEDEGPGRGKILKPIFVPQKERDTIKEREKIEQEEINTEKKKKERLQERKQESRALVNAEITREEEVARADAGVANTDDVDTDDEVNEAEEYELWKTRELARIKRDRDLREQAFKEKEELEKIRSMTEEERKEWERRNPKPKEQKDQKKWKFLQKYYHRGAFFQTGSDDKFGTTDEDTIYKRDFGEAVGEDQMDKSILPKVMQVRRGQFGRSGRSKWTHLVNEDTTNWDNPWSFNDPLRSKYTSKMSGMDDKLAKPSVKDMLKKGTTN